MTSKLDQLKQFTTVVADTGDLDAIARLKPVDATTNPSLLLKAAAMPGYARLLKSAVTAGKGDVGLACDHFGVAVGSEILKSDPGPYLHRGGCAPVVRHRGHTAACHRLIEPVRRGRYWT